MFHPFSSSEIEGVQLPKRFTFPFCYKPHPLCCLASNKLQNYLKQHKELEDWTTQGKMFGVLIVQTPRGDIGFLAAFSGLLAGSYHHDFFVPPVYDLLSPESFFKVEEGKIDSMNIQMEKMIKEFIPIEEEIQQQIIQMQIISEKELLRAKEHMALAKKHRMDLRKAGGLSDNEKAALIKESQFLKAEYNRLKRKWHDSIDEKKGELITLRKPIELLEKQRKTASNILQLKLFEQFVLLNALGEKRSLCDIFKHTSQQIPPAGAGECAAPKMLQYAYNHDLKPIAMAEFWWGKSPMSEVRIQGNYYPSCNHKCGPILAHMLKGLDVEPNPLLNIPQSADNIETIYEDESLLIINKPPGLLSVPGNDSLPSVYSIIQNKYPDANGPLLVHRLDMDTSGLLLVAKNKAIHEELQKLFEGHQVKKRYIALLDGELPTDCPLKGFVKLPLSPDYYNRPCQMVDFENGKPAITRYEIIKVEHGLIDGDNRVYTRMAFYPETGRTHQLRVHSAHTLGLNCPILGDSLYGQSLDRLYLHAEKLEFKHPITGRIIRIESPAPF